MKNRIIHIVIGFTFLLSCNMKHEQKQAEKNVYYTCSMDPQVMETHPGICPICKMELTKVNSAQQDKQRVHLTHNQVLLANIQVQEVKLNMINEEISLVGRVVANENATQTVSSRFEGRIEKLFIKAVGVKIHKGELLYDIYSEEIVATEKEYLSILEKWKTKNNDSESYRVLAEAAKNKLSLWGLDEQQLKAIEKEKNVSHIIHVYSKTDGLVQEISIKDGDYVMEGTTLFKLTDLSEIWVEAQAYANEMSRIGKDKKVSLIVDAFPDERISAKIDFISPELLKQSKINIVRCRLDNKEKKYLPGMRASVNVTVYSDSSIVLPLDAVLQGPEGSIVWVQNEDGTFQSKMVETGIQNATDIEITGGLKAGKKVVVKGVYLLNSEYILKNGTSPMEGHDMSKM